MTVKLLALLFGPIIALAEATIMYNMFDECGFILCMITAPFLALAWCGLMNLAEIRL